jgi:hypothetical protein
MLAVEAVCRDGHIQIATEGLPRESKVVVLFLSSEANTESTHLNPEQRAALSLQSQSHFAQTVLLDPAEDCWNDA